MSFKFGKSFRSNCSCTLANLMGRYFGDSDGSKKERLRAFSNYLFFSFSYVVFGARENQNKPRKVIILSIRIVKSITRTNLFSGKSNRETRKKKKKKTLMFSL
ncbi:hypothetical protein I3842_14G127500 [Carya illinoinensis]|uniref:Uncharacterized protein n=1 Tax=Carya illinoinensis TaxID=32201 RepID=A0A922ADK5_CARIL|nr:hypothetical protein I3842_14G127500 [Carya illinoinensis]